MLYMNYNEAILPRQKKKIIHEWIPSIEMAQSIHLRQTPGTRNGAFATLNWAQRFLFVRTTVQLRKGLEL